jgi:hypothetical protein
MIDREELCFGKFLSVDFGKYRPTPRLSENLTFFTKFCSWC